MRHLYENNLGGDKKEVKLNITLHPKNIEEFYILECLELLCRDNNLSEQKGLLEVLRMRVEELYGMQRRSNNPIFHEKEYQEEIKKRIKNGNGYINAYERNKLKRDFVEDIN